MKMSWLMIFFIIMGLETIAQPTVLPQGFARQTVAAGITQPTTMAQAPDGRWFVAQQNGVLKVVKSTGMNAQPFVTVSTNLDGERGLLGVAVDPNFVTNQYVYICYTVASGSYNIIQRYTASGDTALPGSDTIIFQLDTLIANYHGGGHLDFGPDGKLYVSAGDNGRSAKAQDKDSYLGKILRINADGTTPTDNPFPGPNKRRNVWAFGLRNPFTFAFRRDTTRMFVDDVGEITWEEINDATVGGRNFGWPAHEGFSNDTNYINPFYNYEHGTADSLGCAITGGTFLVSDSCNYPTVYKNRYYYIDYCGNWINSISLTGTPSYSHFATLIPFYSVGITVGRDGNLYFLSRDNEAMYRIKFSTDSFPIVIDHPQDQIVAQGFSASFSVNAVGAPTLNYQWRKDTVAIPGATNSTYTIPAAALSDSGYYNVIVTNTYGADTSDNAHLTVIPNQPPVATIDLPLTNTYYSAGDTIYYHGFGTDPEEGSLPNSVMQWLVEFHHDTHLHPGPFVQNGLNNGSFIIPSVGEVSANVYYRLILVVNDAEGFYDTTYVEILPNTSTITINTEPQGLQLTLDGQPFTTPYSVLGVEGMDRTIGAAYVQYPTSTAMYFTHWSQGGTLIQSITTDTADVTYTATYDSSQNDVFLGNDTIVCINTNFIVDAGIHAYYVWDDESMNHQFVTFTSSVVDTFTVSVTVSDSVGATGHDTITVIFDLCLGLDEKDSEQILVYPNPSTGEIFLQATQSELDLGIYDVAGRIVQSVHVDAQSKTSITLPQGVYYLRSSFLHSKKSYQAKIIVLK